MNISTTELYSVVAIFALVGLLIVANVFMEKSAEQKPSQPTPAALVVSRTYEIRMDGYHFRTSIFAIAAALFGLSAIFAFFYAEICWDFEPSRNGGIGVGASAYATALYARAIALATISAASGVAAFHVANIERVKCSVSRQAPESQKAE